MKNIITFLQGKKTYIIAAGTIIYCLLGVLLHFMTVPAAIAFIGTAGSLAALRGGVGQVQGILNIILEILKLIGANQPPVVPPVVPPAPPAA